jgi:hypothetical protein
MPKQYEEIRDSYLKKGKDEKEAKKLAAMTYNSRHPGHPMNAKTHGHFAKGGHTMAKKKLVAPRLPPQLAGPAMGAPPPGGAPMGAGPGPGAPGMKHGGKTHHKKFAEGGETVKGEQGPVKKWGLKGEESDAHGKKVAMKHGGKTHSRGHGIERKGFSAGGACRGDGIAERGHTRGSFR